MLVGRGSAELSNIGGVTLRGALIADAGGASEASIFGQRVSRKSDARYARLAALEIGLGRASPHQNGCYDQ